GAMTLASEARAQSGITLVPALSVSSVYDDNLLARAGSGDQTTLLTPSVEGSLDTPNVKLLGLYSFDMQRSFDHPALNDVEARRHAMLSGAFRSTPKLTLIAEGNYDRTDNAGELIFLSGLLLEPRPAWRVGLGPGVVAYQTSPLTTLTGQYAWTSE